MNWEAIGALAEALGAAGVIATLAYLATQIRRSNQLATAESNRFGAVASQPITLAIAQDTDVARIFREGLADRESLSADDRVRFDMLLGALVGSFTSAITDQLILGHDLDVAGSQDNLVAFLNAPGGKSWWNDYRARYTKHHVEVVERVLGGHGPPAG